MKELKYTLLLLFIYCSIQLKADDNHLLFRHYQVENGLSDNMVTSCVQDKSGYIWIGTRDGLNRFDGYSFKVFRHDPDEAETLGSNWITYLACDLEGTLWVGTLSGLYRYNEAKESFHHIAFTADKNIDIFQFDKENNLWILMDGNLIQYSTNSNKFRIFSSKNNRHYTSFCITPDNNIWLGDSKGYLSLLNPADESVESYNLFVHSTTETPKKLFMLSPSLSSPSIYVAFEHDDVKIFDTVTRTYQDLNIQKTNQLTILINSFLEKNNKELWIGTDSGLFIYQLNTGECTRIRHDPLNPYALTSHFISAFYRDREGGIWICFHQNGLNYYSPFLPFRIYYPENETYSMKGEVIRDICADSDGNIWVGTEDAGVNCLEKKTGTFTNYRPVLGEKSLSHTNIRGLAVSGDKLWIGHVIHGIDLMDIKTRKVIKHYNLLKDSLTVKNSTVRCIKALREGQIYVGTDDGVYKYDFLNDRFLYAPQFPPFSVNCIYEDRVGRIWTGMFNRSFYYNPVSNTGMYLPYDKLNTQRHNFVNDACEDKDGNMWFATIEGVIKYDFQTGESFHYTVKNGMPSNVAFRILYDENGLLWISTANGLVNLNPWTEKINTYTEAHGLITRQFNENSAFNDHDGKFYFGTVKGFICFDPMDINPSAEKMNVHIGTLEIQNEANEKIIINSSAFSPIKNVTLNHQQSTFNIHFSALNFIAPGSIQYTYRMGNRDKEWIPIGDRNTVYFTELHPGDYIFEVRAANLSNSWNDTPTQLNITVLPPWWASGRAYFIYIIFTLSVIAYSFYAWRKKTKRMMTYNMRLFEDQKEKELYQAKINFFINIAHEIRTPLTLIKNPLERLLKSEKIEGKEKSSLLLMNKNVSRLLLLINQLLDFRKTEIEGYRLNFVRTEIISLLTETVKRFQESAAENHLLLNLDLSMPELYVFVDKEAVIKIFSNLLSNAIKYATAHIIVRVQLSSDYDTFTIDFINDGTPIPAEIKEKIFEPFYRFEKTENKQGTGLGLPLARSLAEMHHGTLRMVDFPDSPSMTLFRLTLPVKLPESIQPSEEEVIPQTTVPTGGYIYQETRPTILIVEDNKEMSTFLADEINQLYNVYIANQGSEAIALLQKHSIQLIISDVMMPVMDGFELLKQIKTDLEFSHIPVILLTAKNTMQTRLEGLELGADAYIEKPFSTDLLMAQIANLLSNRDHIRKFYFNSPIANMKSMAYTKADENFLEKLNEIINENIGNPQLDVNMIADLMHLSRPTLYRKIRAISDLTPNELIKISRLKKAAELLIQGNKKIYEISEAVGFSSQSYFWSAFIKQFGVSPSKYAKENR
ncbi:hybrid sensor histidine kinase/response regulator [Parabacteroides pacaensis]|uniref:hybrid sensor histidine kinase/response regulator n=1 Tax=Parabacteroides pacaensis TaxID=2086575 RepID=UPI000D0FE57B|nr:hybrid sensor histidine kinase/response regulator transcription factor [Parabacteroides pacaensis]